MEVWERNKHTIAIWKFVVCNNEQKPMEKRPVVCTTAHLMHPSNDWTKRARVEKHTHSEKGRKREGKVMKKTWESSKKLLKVREDFEHGNGYEIKIIKFGERNLCKRCYLAWNVYVIMSVQCALCSEAVIHSSTRLGSALRCTALHWTVPYCSMLQCVCFQILQHYSE